MWRYKRVLSPPFLKILVGYRTILPSTAYVWIYEYNEIELGKKKLVLSDGMNLM